MKDPLMIVDQLARSLDMQISRSNYPTAQYYYEDLERIRALQAEIGALLVEGCKLRFDESHLRRAMGVLGDQPWSATAGEVLLFAFRKQAAHVAGELLRDLLVRAINTRKSEISEDRNAG